MDYPSYETWARHHAALFPNWGANMRSAQNASEVSRSMAERLSGVSFEAAKQASDEMASGSLDKPFRDEDHVIRIVQRAREIDFARSSKPTYHDGEAAFRCKHCQDSGLVTIIHPKSAAAARNGAFDEWISWWERRREQIDRGQAVPGPLETTDYPIVAEPVRTCVCHCFCEAGDIREDREARMADSTKTSRPKFMLKFDPDRCTILDTGTWTYVSVRAAREAEPYQGEFAAAFDEWNHS